MAWMEAATVFYLRAKLDRIEPNQTEPLPHPAPVGVLSFGETEILREAATLAMLLIVGWLAGRNARTRWAYVLVAFGVWDIFYYIFLWPMSGWPRTVLDWDVLFLIPFPWWGPVLAPVLIALLMVVGGTLISQFDSEVHPLWPQRLSLGLNFLGVGVALYVFMADAVAMLLSGGNAEAVRNIEPVWFNWLVFGAALVLLAAPVWDVAFQISNQSSRLTAPKGLASK